MSTRNKPRKVMGCALGEGALVTYPGIVKAYKCTYQENASQEMYFYTIQNSLSDVIKLAANAKVQDGAKHSHQWRIPREKRGQVLKY